MITADAQPIPHPPSLLQPALLNPHYNPAIPSAPFQLPIITSTNSLDNQALNPSKSFDDILASSDLPPPGPDHFAARRALWLAPRSSSPPRTPEPSTSRRRLQEVLSSPGAERSDQVWHGGVEKVWKGLSAGGRLKRRLPMNLIVRPGYNLRFSFFTFLVKIKILHAAWLRDNTWPAGAAAPDSDDAIPDVTSHQPPKDIVISLAPP